MHSAEHLRTNCKPNAPEVKLILKSFIELYRHQNSVRKLIVLATVMLFVAFAVGFLFYFSGTKNFRYTYSEQQPWTTALEHQIRL